LRIKRNQAPILGYLVYLHAFFVNPVFNTAVPAVILIHTHFASGFTATRRAIQNFSPPVKVHYKNMFLKSLYLNGYYVHVMNKKCSQKDKRLQLLVSKKMKQLQPVILEQN
jgi:hypothetical protein